MRTRLITLSILLASVCAAQTTVTLPSFQLSNEGLATFRTWALQQVVSVPTQLASPALSTDTTFSVVSAAGLAPGTGLLIESESSIITSVSGTTLTVTRGLLGTTAAAHAAEVNVGVLQYATFPQWCKMTIGAGLQALMEQVGSPAVNTQKATIAAALAAIAAAKTAAIQ